MVGNNKLINEGVVYMKRTMFLLAVMTLTWASQLEAAELKVGYVDIKTAMENTRDYRTGLKRLEALESKKTKQLETMRNRITDLDKELQMQSMTMSNEHKMAKQEELAQLKKEFDRELQDSSDELKGEKRKLDQVLVGKFYEAVREFGQKNKFDIILPKSVTIYTNGNHDVTADITTILDTK